MQLKLFSIFIMYFVPLVIVFIQSFPRLIHTGTDRHGSDLFNPHAMFCSFVRHSEIEHFGDVKKFGVVSLCAAIVGFSYSRIYALVRRQRRRIIGTGGLSNHVRLNHELSLLKSAVGIFLTFTISYLPITVVYGLDRERVLPEEVYFVGVVLMWLSPSVNWVVYGLMNTKFARAYRCLLCVEKTSSDSRQQWSKPVVRKDRRCTCTSGPPASKLVNREIAETFGRGLKLARNV